MKFSATFEEKVKKAEEQGDRPLVSSYLNPSKVDPKEPVSFALLEEDPLIFWKIYGESVHGDKGKSFRFVSKPTEEEILTEMGGSYQRGARRCSRSARPRPPSISTGETHDAICVGSRRRHARVNTLP